MVYDTTSPKYQNADAASIPSKETPGFTNRDACPHCYNECKVHNAGVGIPQDFLQNKSGPFRAIGVLDWALKMGRPHQFVHNTTKLAYADMKRSSNQMLGMFVSPILVFTQASVS